MLLGSSPNRLLMKDERQSPAIAEGGGERAQLPRQTHEDCGASRKK
jgi:hypothetical protein